MLPSPGCDPDINVIVLGAKILTLVTSQVVEINWLLNDFSKDAGVSIDHVILTIDWLYMIDAIYVDGERILVYETH